MPDLAIAIVYYVTLFVVVVECGHCLLLTIADLRADRTTLGRLLIHAIGTAFALTFVGIVAAGILLPLFR